MLDVELTPSAASVQAHSSIPDPSAPSRPATNNRPGSTIPYSCRERHPDVQIIYIRDHERANRELERLQSSGPYGFDIEWKPTFTKGQSENRVALVQIANHETILLLQVKQMKEFPSKLTEFLLNPDVTKVGVGIRDDALKLYRDWRADLTSCVELALLARTVDNARWKGRYTQPLGLAHLIAVYEDRVLPKGKITRSNWELILTEPQKIYAAHDAHAGYVLYEKLLSMLPSVSPQPEAKCYTFDAIGGQLYVPFGHTIWQPSNPNYDPGPPPPPREPKPQKRPKSRENPPINPVDQTQSLIDWGSGSALPLPALQSSSSPQGLRFSRRGYLQSNGSSQGSHFPSGHSQPTLNPRGNRGGYRGNSSYCPLNHTQLRPLHFTTQNNQRQPHHFSTMTHHFRPTDFSPPGSRPAPQGSGVETLPPWSTSTYLRNAKGPEEGSSS